MPESNAAARPEGQSHHRSRRGGRVAVVHALLSVRHGARRGSDRRGRGRQPCFSIAPPASPSTRPAIRIPAVVAAIVEQAGKFLHMSGTDFYYEPQVRLGEEMNAIAPWQGPKKSFFSNSGTEAIEAAVKLARYHTRRHGIIAFLGSFHGRTMGSLSLTSSRAIQRKGFGPPLPGVYHAPYPNPYRRPARAERRRMRGRGDGVHRGADPRPPRVAGRSSGRRRRVDSGRRRLCRAAAGVSPGAARDDAQARHAADRGRSAVGHGPHRPHVRDRALRRRARHRLDGQGHRLGPAARRDDRARGRDGVASGLACEHVRRQSRCRARRRWRRSSCSRTR